MNKEKYIKDKKVFHIDVHAAWEMYNDSEHKTKISLNEFLSIFPMWVSLGHGNGKKYWEYYDNKFDIK